MSSAAVTNGPGDRGANAGVLPTGGVELTESSGRALKLQTDAPHLVSMGGDRLSTAVTLHPLPQGRVTLGSGSGVDIPVQGTGVLPLHCHIENSEGVVTLYPIAGNLSVDGIHITGPTRLTQGVMLTIGRSNYMRFNHPAEAKLMKLTNSRISMAPITFEHDEIYQPKFSKKPPTVPRKSPRNSYSDEEPSQSSIMMKVSKFEYLAAQNFKQSLSPKVFSSNLVTVNMPAKDVLGRTPPDLHSYAKNISQPAVNYGETNFKNKTPDRQIFGCKSPCYVNVQLNEAKTINNKVVIFENGSVMKEHHELNNITRNYNQNANKNVNVAKGQTRCGTPNGENKSNVSSYEDLSLRKNEAEIKRNQAQVDRIKEQQIEKAEQARLEEILNMCAEFDKQVQCDKSNKPTPNRIKTNGSLPRDKRTCISPNFINSPKLGSSPHDTHIFKFESQESVTGQNLQQQYEETQKSNSGSGSKNMSAYENVAMINGSPTLPLSSPRTRIKTFVTPNKESSPKESTTDLFDSSLSKAKTLPSKFITPAKFKDEHGYMKHLENYENLTLNNHTGSIANNLNFAENKENTRPDDNAASRKIFALKEEKRDKLTQIATIKRRIAEMDNMGEELSRELELEKALIKGECKAKQLELEKLQARKECLLQDAHNLDLKMNESQLIQEEDQRECKEKLEIARELVESIEAKLSELNKDLGEYNSTFEEYLEAQENLDNENKKFEDLEFHHLEEEADMLASREEHQREVMDLTKKMDELKKQINDLQRENSITATTNANEFGKIEEKRLEFSKVLENVRIQLRDIDVELANLKDRETDDDLSTDSDTDKPKDLDTVRREASLLSLNKVCDMSTSFIVSSTKIYEEDFNMSQSFNEKMLHEKSILEDGMGRRIPSQGDIDRISKVTMDAPMNIEDNRFSLSKKAFESLKEIERNRQLHLAQQGSQVIENERRRVLALKQKVQNEVRTKWAARKQDCQSFNSIGSDDTQNGNLDPPSPKDEVNSNHVPSSPVQPRDDSISPDSPRPLSETSDVSVEVGTIGRRRGKNLGDKHRPLTRFLPIRSVELDLRQHIESAGHQADLCPHVRINSTSCRGFLHKRGSKLNGWSRRWFVFDRVKRTLVYYSDKTEKKPRGGAYFQAIEEVYLDHANSVKSSNPHLTFIVKTHERYYYLMAPSPEAMRIWIDVIFTGAEGYQEFEHGT